MTPIDRLDDAFSKMHHLAGEAPKRAAKVVERHAKDECGVTLTSG